MWMVGIVVPGDKVLRIAVTHCCHILTGYLHHLAIGKLPFVLCGEVERDMSHWLGNRVKATLGIKAPHYRILCA